MSGTTTVVLIVILVAIAAVIGNKRQNTTMEKPRKRRFLLTKNESAMFNRLTEAAPEAVVLAQVSFGALITATSKGARNRFDRKIADFVICNRAHQVLAVIELDDSSHQGKEDRDASRDRLLTDAGYRVIRYAHIPDTAKVREDLPEVCRPPLRAEK